MILTITPSTIVTITAATATGLADSIALIVVLTFLALWVQQEMVSTVASGWANRLHRGLKIGLIPLGIAFLMIVVKRIT